MKLTKKINLLHLGMEENLREYTPDNEFTRSVHKISMHTGLPATEYVAAMPDADVIAVSAIGDVTAELIDALPNLKLIHSNGVGFNCIDVEAAGKRGIPVCNCAGMNAEAVAEQTLMLMVGVLHDVINNDRAVREGRQSDVKHVYMANGTLKTLSDCKVGLIGFGNIGQSIAELLKVCHADTYYTQRHRTTAATERAFGVTWVASMDELLAKCDIVSLHLPVTPTTERMCDDAFFSKMKDGSYFINTARGELVDDEALIRALKSGKLKMAGIDTLDDEPIKKSHILLNQPADIASRMIFSPHIGGVASSCFRKGYTMIWDNIRRLVDGAPLEHIVNEKYLK